MSLPIGAPQSDDGRRHPGRWMARGLFALLLALVAAGFALQLADGDALWGRDAEHLVRSWGTAGVAASLALLVAHTFVPFPAEFVAIANGMVFGVLLGTAITWAGAMLGAALSFGLARRLVRPDPRVDTPARHCGAAGRSPGAGGLLQPRRHGRRRRRCRLVDVPVDHRARRLADDVDDGPGGCRDPRVGVLAGRRRRGRRAPCRARLVRPDPGASAPCSTVTGTVRCGRLTGSSISERPQPGDRTSRSEREPHHGDAVHRLVVGTEAAVVLEFGPAENADQASRRCPGRLPPKAQVRVRTPPSGARETEFRET